jgi:hypothetical protein
MKKFIVLGLGALLLAVTFFMLNDKVEAASAVAIKRWGNGHAWGYSYNATTIESAKEIALKRCNEDYGGGCEITMASAGPGWWAIVHRAGNPGLGDRGILCIRGGYQSEQDAIQAAQSCAGNIGTIKNTWYDAVGASNPIYY